MSAQTQVQRKPREREETRSDTKTDHPVSDAAREHLADIDDLLDEIDEILEEEAEEFVKGYVQKGGQ